MDPSWDFKVFLKIYSYWKRHPDSKLHDVYIPPEFFFSQLPPEVFVISIDERACDTTKKEKFENGDLGGGFKYFLCSSLPGGMIQFDDHIFQLGWNHQPETESFMRFFSKP